MRRQQGEVKSYSCSRARLRLESTIFGCVDIVSFGVVLASIDTLSAVVVSRGVSSWIPDLSIKGPIARLLHTD